MVAPNMSTESGPAVAPDAPSVIPKALPKSVADKRPKAVPVWDPDAQALKAIAPEQAQEFIDMGYKVGGDAQVEALNNSPLAKGAALTSGTANATSAGTFNALLSSTHGGRGLLKTEEIASEANPGYRLAGEIGGVLATGAAGGFTGAAEGLTADAIGMGEAAVATDMLGGKALLYGAKAARIGLDAAPYMAIKGAMDTVTEDNILNHPITAQQIAAGSFHSVVEGAGFNFFAHGIGKSASYLRKGVGNSLDYAEKWGLSKRELEEVPFKYGPEGKPMPKEREYERRYKQGTDPDAPVSETAVVPKSDSPAVADLRTAIEQHAAPDMSAMVAEPVPPMAPLPAGAEEAVAPTIIPGHYPDYEPYVPMPRKPIREPGKIGSAKEQLEKYTSELELKEAGLGRATEAAESVGKQEIPRATPKSTVEEVIDDIPLEDRPLTFGPWQKGVSPRGKRIKLRAMIEERLAEAHPEAPDLWKRSTALGDEIEALLPDKTKPGIAQVIKAKQAEKLMIKERLKIMAPREEDKVAGIIKPSFKDYDDEYARTFGKDRLAKDIQAPGFGVSEAAEDITKAARAHVEREVKAAESELKEHRSAQGRVQTSEDAVARAEIKVKIAGDKLTRLEKEFETFKVDTPEYLDAKDARSELLAKRRYDARIKAMKARDAAKAEVKRANEAKKAADEHVKEIRKLAEAQEKKLDAARKKVDAAQKQSEKDYKRAEDARARQAEREKPTKGSKEVNRRQWETAEGIHTETKTTRIKNGFVHEKYHIKVDPHAPPKVYQPGKLKIPWTGSDFSNVAKAGFFTGQAHFAGVAAAAMAGHNGIIHLANNRKAIGEAWEKWMGGLARGAGATYKTVKRAHSHSTHGAMSPESLSRERYDEVTKAVGYLRQNPGVVQSHLQKNYPNFTEQKPQVVASVAANIQKALEQLDQVIPKRPFAPTLQDARFHPTRAQQIQVLKMWQALGNPQMAIGFGDHTVFSALDAAYPDLTQSHREQLMHQISNAKAPLRGRQARQYSQFIGAPVRPNDDAAALKRLQQTAGPEPMKKPAGGQSGGGSSKVRNQTVTRDLPAGSQSQLGG